MNASVWSGSDSRTAQIMRISLRCGRRLSHHLLSLIGCAAVVSALALWLLPSWRTTLAARIMPFVSAAVQAGPARLLAGQPLPPFSAVHRAPADWALSENIAATIVPPVSSKADTAPAAVASSFSGAAGVTTSANSMAASALGVSRGAGASQRARARRDTGREVGLDPLLLLS